MRNYGLLLTLVGACGFGGDAVAQSCDFSDFGELVAQRERIEDIRDVFLDWNEVEGLVRDSALDFEIVLTPGEQARMKVKGVARTVSDMAGKTASIVNRIRRLNMLASTAPAAAAGGTIDIGPTNTQLNVLGLFVVDGLELMRQAILDSTGQLLPVDEALEIFREQEAILERLEKPEEFACRSRDIAARFFDEYQTYREDWDRFQTRALSGQCGDILAIRRAVTVAVTDGELAAAARQAVLANNPYSGQWHLCGPVVEQRDTEPVAFPSGSVPSGRWTMTCEGYEVDGKPIEIKGEFSAQVKDSGIIDGTVTYHFFGDITGPLKGIILKDGTIRMITTQDAATYTMDGKVFAQGDRLIGQGSFRSDDGECSGGWSSL